MASPESVQFTADTVVYIAAAGSGKTSALMGELTGALKTYRPDEIAFVTYTRKGVGNGIERALQANPQLAAEDLVYFRTLHSLCFRALGLKHTDTMSREDIRHFNRQTTFNLTLRDDFEHQTDDDKLLVRYDAVRSGSTKGSIVHAPYDEGRYERLTRAYEAFKKHGAKDQFGNTIRQIDFFDCLLLFKKRNEPIPVKVAFIDEAQDLTLLQWEVCQIAFSACEKVRIAGDDFQSLFFYAGGSPETLICLAKKYRTVKLETTYRLPVEVYRFAKGIVDLIVEKEDKEFKPVKDVRGFVEEVSDRSVLARQVQKDIRKNGYPPNRWYFLFRNNCFIEDVAGMLEQRGIPYHTAQGFCVPERELSKIKRYYNFRKTGYSSREAFEKFCADNHIQDITEEFIESDLISSERRYVYFDYVQKFGVDALEEMSRKEPFLLLSTTHRVKGGEADYVAVFLDCTEKVYHNSQLNLDEELRVLYVACTRARTGLYLMARNGQHGLDGLIGTIKERMPKG